MQINTLFFVQIVGAHLHFLLTSSPSQRPGVFDVSSNNDDNTYSRYSHEYEYPYLRVTCTRIRYSSFGDQIRGRGLKIGG